MIEWPEDSPPEVDLLLCTNVDTTFMISLFPTSSIFLILEGGRTLASDSLSSSRRQLECRNDDMSKFILSTKPIGTLLCVQATTQHGRQVVEGESISLYAMQNLLRQ
jgi:hypothetical protein